MRTEWTCSDMNNIYRAKNANDKKSVGNTKLKTG